MEGDLKRANLSYSLRLQSDMWAVGCIFAELITLKPLFQGQEVKATQNPFQVCCFFEFAASVVLSLGVTSSYGIYMIDLHAA